MRAHDKNTSITAPDAPGPWLAWVDERRAYRVVARNGSGHYQYQLERREGYDQNGQERWVAVDPYDADAVRTVPQQLIDMVVHPSR